MSFDSVNEELIDSCDLRALFGTNDFDFDLNKVGSTFSSIEADDMIINKG